jgi:hypothetical protein
MSREMNVVRRSLCWVEAPGVMCGKREASDEEDTILFLQDSHDPAALEIKADWTDVGEVSVSISSIALHQKSEKFFTAKLTGVLNTLCVYNAVKNHWRFQVAEVRDQEKAQVELIFHSTTMSHEVNRCPFRLIVKLHFKSGSYRSFSHLFKVYKSHKSAKQFLHSVLDTVPRDVRFTRKFDPSVGLCPCGAEDLSVEIFRHLEAVERCQDTGEARQDAGEVRQEAGKVRQDELEARQDFFEARQGVSEARNCKELDAIKSRQDEVVARNHEELNAIPLTPLKDRCNSRLLFHQF